jgi:nitrogen-specific signal transduction histidine kinase
MLAIPDLFAVLDQLGDAVVILDREFRIVAHNAAAERLGMRLAADIATAPLWDTSTSLTGGNFQEDLRRAMSKRIPLHSEHRIVDATSNLVQLRVHILPTEPGLTVVARDIADRGDTGRSQREERARQLQELTAALSAALDPESVGAAIIERAMPALGRSDASGRSGPLRRANPLGNLGGADRAVPASSPRSR